MAAAVCTVSGGMYLDRANVLRLIKDHDRQRKRKVFRFLFFSEFVRGNLSKKSIKGLFLL